MTEWVPPQVPPNYTQMTKAVAEVANDLDNGRHFGGLWRNWASGKLQKRGEAYMDGSRILYEQCGSLMALDDKIAFLSKYDV